MLSRLQYTGEPASAGEDGRAAHWEQRLPEERIEIEL